MAQMDSKNLNGQEAGRRAQDSEDDFDEFYDRTGSQKFKGAGDGVAPRETLTYESLKEALAELQQQLQTLTHQFNNFGAHHNAQVDEEADELDQFMETNKATLSQDEKQKLAKKIVDVTNKI